MNDIDWFEQEVMGMRIFTARQREAAKFLEAHGLKFFLHYGVSNCEQLATEMGWCE